MTAKPNQDTSTVAMAQPNGSPIGKDSTRLDPFPRVDFLLKTCYTIMDSRTMKTHSDVVAYLVGRMAQYNGGYY